MHFIRIVLGFIALYASGIFAATSSATKTRPCSSSTIHVAKFDALKAAPTAFAGVTWGNWALSNVTALDSDGYDQVAPKSGANVIYTGWSYPPTPAYIWGVTDPSNEDYKIFTIGLEEFYFACVSEDGESAIWPVNCSIIVVGLWDGNGEEDTPAQDPITTYGPFEFVVPPNFHYVIPRRSIELMNMTRVALKKAVNYSYTFIQVAGPASANVLVDSVKMLLPNPHCP